MKTPICDFLKEYSDKKPSRLHMPGHKGNGPLGIEKYDITEIRGADVLYSAGGIIRESEECASSLFKTGATLYSTEGSTLAIKAMLAIAIRRAGVKQRQTVLAARNVHKAFVFAAAQLDFDISWILPERSEHIASQTVGAEELSRALAAMGKLPAAVYITSPDYLGGCSDIAALSAVCKRFGVPLLVDNAHGAYLAFLEPSRHPLALGAAMCCDSAHKTLPVLTGGAYLHISSEHPELIDGAEDMLSLFASTSPSYITLASIDSCNAYIANGYGERLRAAVARIDGLKAGLAEIGLAAEDSDPLKIVIKASKYGYSGEELAEGLWAQSCECEMADGDYLVLMLTPENTEDDYVRIFKALSGFKPRASIEKALPAPEAPVSVMSIREAILSKSEELAAERAVGRILSQPSVGCPPAVPIAICGERLTADAVSLFLHYGIKAVRVVSESDL